MNCCAPSNSGADELLAGTLHGNLPHAIDPVRRAARRIACLLEAIDAVNAGFAAEKTLASTLLRRAGPRWCTRP